MNSTNNVNSPFAQEVQGTVAKLLATENIRIHRSTNYSTAFFDVEKRLLGLPVFNDVSKDVYDLLIGHEVGHALYTEKNDFARFLEKFKSKMLYNVLEDIRIEKIIQQTYPGLISIFTRAYKELTNRKFFGNVDAEALSKMNLLDRINLRAKAGPKNLDVPFSTDELPIVTAALGIMTYADIETVAQLLIDFNEKKKEEEKPQPKAKYLPKNEMPSGDDMQSTEQSAESDSDEDGEKPQSKNIDPSEKSKDSASTDEFESQTQKAFDNAVQSQRNSESKDFEFIQPTAEQLKACVKNYKEVLAERDAMPAYIATKATYAKFNHYADSYAKFRKSTKRGITVLKNEFERKRAAYQYTRSGESTRGVINVNALHRYKFSSDIFSRVVNMPNGQSHGMVFLLDYSGSMRSKLADIIEQLVIITDFCRSIKIPFSVYSFTTSTSTSSTPTDGICLSTTLLKEVLSSDMSRAEYERAVYDLYFSLNGEMGSTPLLESMVVFHKIINDFKIKYKLQIVNTIILTDGQGQSMRFEANYGKYYAYGNLFGSKRIMLSAYRAFWENFKTLALNLKSTFNVNVIYFFVGSKRDISNTIHGTVQQTCNVPSAEAYKVAEKHIQTLKNNKVCKIENHAGCDKFIFMLSDKGDTFDFAEADLTDASEAQIRNAFTKSLLSTKQTKLFAAEFIETVTKSF